MKTFSLFKEEKENNAVGSKISLGDGNDYKPFEISDDPKSEHYGKNKNFAPIVRAFKQGANWGWSRDDNTGNDKPIKIGSKKLYLSGGTVRDHLAGKKPRNIELSTNASPDEIYHILKQNGFEFVDKKDSLGKDKKFWVTKFNKNKRPFAFGINVNGDEFELEIFTKTPKGNVDKELEAGNHTDDAYGRDFTLNGMYILLSNDNGPNKELIDFYGGMHHMKNKKIVSIGDMKNKLKEDPSRIIRYVRMLTSYGDPQRISEEEKDAIRKSSSNLGKLDRKYMMSEFKKGLDKEDIDSRQYMIAFKDLGLLNHLFPAKNLDDNFPKELSEIGDKHMPLAWMLRNNDLCCLDDCGMDSSDVKKIKFLIKSLGIDDNLDKNLLYDLMNDYLTSGISGRKLKDFVIKLGGSDGNTIDSFLKYTKTPRVKVFQVNDDGEEIVSKEFQDLIDPFTGEIIDDEVNERKKDIEFYNFVKKFFPQ